MPCWRRGAGCWPSSAASSTALFLTYSCWWPGAAAGEQVDCNCFGADRRRPGLGRPWPATSCSSCSASWRRPSVPPAPASSRRSATSGRTDWWWLVLTAAVAATAVLVVGLRRAASRRSPTTTCSTTTAPRSPSPCWRTSPGRASRSRSWPPSAPSCWLFLSIHLLGVRVGRAELAGGCSQLGPVEISTVFTEPLERASRQMRPRRRPRCGSTSRAARPTPSPTGRPSRRPAGRRRSLAGGPVAGADDVATFVEEIVAELSSAPDLPVPHRSPSTPPSAPTTTGTTTGTAQP